MAVMDKLNRVTKIAHTKLHDKKMKDIITIYKDRADVEILTSTKGLYYTIDEVTTKFLEELGIGIPVEVFEEFLLYPVSGNASDFRPNSSIDLEVLNNSSKDLLAKSVLKVDDRGMKFLVNKDPIDTYPMATALLVLEFCVSLKKFRVDTCQIGEVVMLTLDTYNPIILRTIEVDALLDVIQSIHTDAGFEIFTHIGRILRKYSPEIYAKVAQSANRDITDIVKGF